MRKNTSLLKGVVVRGCDEFSRRIVAGDRISRDFSLWGRCALRVTGAHQNSGRVLWGRGLGWKQSKLLEGTWGREFLVEAVGEVVTLGRP